MNLSHLITLLAITAQAMAITEGAVAEHANEAKGKLRLPKLLCLKPKLNSKLDPKPDEKNPTNKADADSNAPSLTAVLDNRQAKSSSPATTPTRTQVASPRTNNSSSMSVSSPIRISSSSDTTSSVRKTSNIKSLGSKTTTDLKSKTSKNIKTSPPITSKSKSSGAKTKPTTSRITTKSKDNSKPESSKRSVKEGGGPKKSKRKKLGVPALAGIASAGAIVLIIAAIFAGLWVRRRG